MSDRVWVKHPALGVSKEIARTGLRVLARGGWQEMSEQEVAQLLEQRAAERAQRTAALTPAPSPPPESPAPTPVKSEKATARAAKSEKQES